MNITFKDITGNPLQFDSTIDKIIIYGDGAKLFERETDLEAQEITTNDNGEKKLRSIYHGAPVAITLQKPVKTARKENLNRTDNYTLKYTPTYCTWERRTALYIHNSEIKVTDMGDILSMETDEEKMYLHTVKLNFKGPATFHHFHVEHIQCDGNWTIPDNGKWSNSIGAYGTEESPIYDTYDYTDSPLKRIREKGKGVVKRWITSETIENAEIIATERFYSKFVYSEERKRKVAIAEKLNQSKEYQHSNDKWSHYDITKLESALGYKLTIDAPQPVSIPKAAHTMTTKATVNNMCTNCKKYRSTCDGTNAKVWTGCAMKEA